jgi:HK97 family phage prohead protease
VERPIKTRANSDARICGKAEGNGWLEGYAAVFGNVDAQGEVIRKGAFAKTITERVPAGKVPLMVVHRRDGGDAMQIVGRIVEAREDDVGLWIRAEFGSDADSQAARAKVADGLVRGLSIGYTVIGEAAAQYAGQPVTELVEIKLLEVTLTAFPANEQAGVTMAKSIGPEAPPADPPQAPAPQAARTDWDAAIRRRRIRLIELED